MWHEARKQERLIRGMIVDYRRRAERRRDFYEKIKADPTQFLQIHGRPCKIHLDPAVAAAGDSPAIMMPWQGDASNLIDRFDVRAHLDHIPDIKIPEVPVEELSQDERHCNYESYRILAQNSFLGINEDKFLHQLEIDEQFGVTVDEKEQQREKNIEKKGTGAAIAYSYSDTGAPSTSAGEVKAKAAVETEDSGEESDLELMDVDLSIDVTKVEPQQAHALNLHGPSFGMAGCDFFSFLTGDADDAESERQLLLEEREKALYSGRKSRRERRAHRDKKQSMRVLSPPSYAAPPAPSEREPTRSPTRSRSPSPAPPTTIQFITSFGGEEEEEIEVEPARKPLYADKVKQKIGPSFEKTFASAVKEGPQRYKRSVSPRRSWESRRRSPSPRPYRRTRSRSPLSSSLTSTSVSRSRSRSRTRRTRSKSSRSRSKSSRSRSRSRRRNSRSPSKLKEGKSDSVPLPLPRYYGRRKAEKDSSSELSVDSSDSSDDTNATDKNDVLMAGGKSGSYQNSHRGVANKGGKPGGDALTLKERLRKKMQAQLSRQLRADQRAQAERQEKELQLQQEREDEMRELAIRMRRRQREMRHRSDSRNSNSSRSERSPSETRSVDSSKVRERSRGQDRCRSRSRSRSISPAPPPRKIAVWASDKEEETDVKHYDVRSPPPSFRKRPEKSIFDKIPRKVPVWEANPDFEMKGRHDSETRRDDYDRNKVWESQDNPGSSRVPQNRGQKYERRVPVVWESEEPHNRNVRPPRPALLGNQPDGYDSFKNQNYRERNFDDRKNFRNEDRFRGGQANTWTASNSREGKSYYRGDRRDERYDNEFRRSDGSKHKQDKKLVDY